MPGSIYRLKGFIYQIFASGAGWRVASLCRFSDAIAGNLLPLRKDGRRKTGGRLPLYLYCASKAWPLTPMLSGPIRYR